MYLRSEHYTKVFTAHIRKGKFSDVNSLIRVPRAAGSTHMHIHTRAWAFALNNPWAWARKPATLCNAAPYVCANICLLQSGVWVNHTIARKNAIQRWILDLFSRSAVPFLSSFQISKIRTFPFPFRLCFSIKNCFFAYVKFLKLC